MKSLNLPALLVCLLWQAAPATHAGRPSTRSLMNAIVEVPRIDSIAPSPDGSEIAFRVARRSVADNTTTIQWYIVPNKGRQAAEPLGTPQRPTWLPLFDFVEDGQAVWSADNRTLFVKEMTNSQIQVHEIGVHGYDKPITHDDADIVDFSIDWSTGMLRYTTRSARAAIEREQAAEEDTGIHFNRSIFSEGLPLTRNFRIGKRETTLRTIDASTAQEAFSGDLIGHAVERFQPEAGPTRSAGGSSLRDFSKPGQRLLALSIAGARVIARLDEANSNSSLNSPRFRLTAQLDNGTIVSCRAEFCFGDPSSLREMMRSPRAGEVIVLYEKDYSARTGIYGWTPATGSVRTLVTPTGSIDGGSPYETESCPLAGTKLVCTSSAPDQPPRLISVDLNTGGVETLYASVGVAKTQALLRDVGAIRYLEWININGRPANGILYLPKGRASKLPLVITTPRCRGFLRGGSGNLTPELELVTRGIAALCVNNDNGVPLTSIEADPTGLTALSMHKAAVASWATIIGILGDQGIVDRDRVGISGHSYSSILAAYALSHTNLFAAASLGTGITIDPMDYYLMAAPADSWRRLAFSGIGLPSPTKDSGKVWDRISPSLNASHIRAPVLIQPPETEYLLALQLYGSIQDAGGTVDMFVYPDEGHAVERHPRHMSWRMSRSVDWFERWLMPKNSGAMTVPKLQHPPAASRGDNHSS